MGRDPEPTRRGPAGAWLKLAVGVGAAAGVAVGATALAQAATSSGGTDADAAVGRRRRIDVDHHDGPRPDARLRWARSRSGAGSAAVGSEASRRSGSGGGPVIDGQFTIKGPNGYETLSERTGTVSDVTDTSGSTWSLTVKSADGTSGTFTVDSGTSVNGGEMGIGSVKTGDTVQVTAVVSGGTSTAKEVTDQTVAEGQRRDVAADAARRRAREHRVGDALARW